MNSVNYFCCEGEYDKVILQKAFNINPTSMVTTGIPRNDALYHATDNDKNNIRERLGLPLDKKIILCAPTWRDSEDNGATCAIKPPITASFWNEQLKDDYIILFRTHAYTNTLMGVVFDDFIRDFSSYPNVNDLLIASDILISDYSSIMIDFSYLWNFYLLPSPPHQSTLPKPTGKLLYRDTRHCHNNTQAYSKLHPTATPCYNSPIHPRYR